MNLEYIILGSLVVIEAVVGFFFLAWLVGETRHSHASRAAIRHGQEHIAALAAEVLRSTPGR
jgi:hypothetical protein